MPDEYDQALVEFHRRAPEYGPGFAGHGPMAAEALVRLGHRSLIPALVDVLAARMPPVPGGVALAAEERAPALGHSDRFGDWLETWRAELIGPAAAGWRDTLRGALPLLLPGAFASAGHAWLRVAHAVRALEEADSEVRRCELAHGLAFWAARFQPLPGVAGARAQAGLGPGGALAAVPVLEPRRRSAGLFTQAVAALDRHDPFRAAIERVDLDAASPEVWISEACAAGAFLYLANPGARIAYAHCVTLPASLRTLLPLLDEAGRRAARGVVFQAMAALHATNAGTPEPADPRQELELLDRERLAGELEELRYRAACSLEEHAIKLVEACLREDAIAPAAELRRAAADAALALGAGSWG